MCTLGFAICIFCSPIISSASVCVLQVFAVTTLCKTSLQPMLDLCGHCHHCLQLKIVSSTLVSWVLEFVALSCSSKYLSGIRIKPRPDQPSKSMCCHWLSGSCP